MAGMHPAAGGHGALGLKQWNVNTPPGWKPHSYPLKEYEEYLSLWAKMTNLEEKKLGPAIASRLEGSALKVALELKVHRVVAGGATVVHSGADALGLPTQEEELDAMTGAVVMAVLFSLEPAQLGWSEQVFQSCS